MSYKLFFAIAAANDLEVEQRDVKTAFLYGDIDIEVYVEQPEGFGEIGKSDKVCKLLDSEVRPHYLDRFVIEKQTH